MGIIVGYPTESEFVAECHDCEDESTPRVNFDRKNIFCPNCGNSGTIKLQPSPDYDGFLTVRGRFTLTEPDDDTEGGEHTEMESDDA